MKYLKFIHFVIASVISMFLITSCNDSSNPDDSYVISTDVGVTGFSLKNDSKVLSNLDSVFFSIDLEKGLIFNADSLPKDTKITTLIPVISYPSTVASAIITMSGGEYKSGTVDYKKNPTDSIDFTGKVVLTLVAQDGLTTRDYTIKVNVHNMEPDSLWWDKLAVAELPSRKPSPIKQRTVAYNEKAMSLILENDGTYTIATTDNPNQNKWSKEETEFGFTPDLRSFASTSDALYILDSEGKLYKSEDALTWSTTGEQWISILGGYQSSLLGIREVGGELMHTRYPMQGAETVIDSQFPIKGFSNFSTFSNKWMEEPIGILCCGQTQDGTLTQHTWGFDGQNWAKLSNHTPPAVFGGTLIPYVINKQTSSLWITTEYDVWFFVGGMKADGSFNTDLYVSYDNGVNWFIGSDLTQMPDYIPGMMNSDNLVISTKMSGNFEPKGWASMPSKLLPSWYRISYEVDGYNVTWECPYIYLIGGENASGQLYNTIWKGVINRLTFVPLM